jgi:hypothetical protein
MDENEIRQLTIEGLDTVSGGTDLIRFVKDLAVSALSTFDKLAGGSTTIEHMIDAIDPLARQH